MSVENDSKKPSRYERVKTILDQAAGDSTANYQGHGPFWNLPLEEFLVFELAGVRMIAVQDDSPYPPSSTSLDPGENSCCHGDDEGESSQPGKGGGLSAIPRCYGRGARSGLIRGLKGEFPFDGSHMPRLPWGDGAKPVSASDIQFIQNWIDSCCPPDDETVQTPPSPERTWQAACYDPSSSSGASLNTHMQRLGGIKVRKNVASLSETELCELRYAVAELKSLNKYPDDNRSFIAWARIHGDHCEHGWEQFLPWHRVFLYEFELALQDIVPGVTLPYWDWPMPDYQQGEVPKGMQSAVIPEAYRCWLNAVALKALQDGGYIPKKGSVLRKLKKVEDRKFNSCWELFAQAGLSGDDFIAYNQPVVAQLEMVNSLWHYKRFPGMFYQGNSAAPADPQNWRQAYALNSQGTPQLVGEAGLHANFHHHYPRQSDIDQIMEINDWQDFGGGHSANASFGILSQNPHNTGHIWLGGANPFWDNSKLTPQGQLEQPQWGDMFYDLLAAYDPMFWGHHSNVDRMWADWQQRHPGLNPDNPSDVLIPFNYPVRDTYNITRFGYEYAHDVTFVPTDSAQGINKFNTHNIPMGGATADRSRRVEVRFHQVRRAVQSHLVRVFINLPNADATTPIQDNDNYVGYIARFGHGECVGGPGHCEQPDRRPNKFDRRPRHHNTHHQYRLDATECVKKLLARGETELQVNVVVLDPNGNACEGLRMEGVTLNFM